MAEGKGENGPGSGLLERVVLQGLNLGTDIARARLLPNFPDQPQNFAQFPSRGNAPPVVAQRVTGGLDTPTMFLMFGSLFILLLATR